MNFRFYACSLCNSIKLDLMNRSDQYRSGESREMLMSKRVMEEG